MLCTDMRIVNDWLICCTGFNAVISQRNPPQLAGMVRGFLANIGGVWKSQSINSLLLFVFILERGTFPDRNCFYFLSLCSVHPHPCLSMRLYKKCASSPKIQTPPSIGSAKSITFWGLSSKEQCVVSQAQYSLCQYPNPLWRTNSWFFRPSQ